MSQKIPTIGLNNMLKAGTRELSGLDEAVYQNIDACVELSRMTRTSLGPNGLFKMILNNLEKLIVTKNAGAIVSELQIKHPASKMLVLAAQNQAMEYGDGTNLVLTLAGELLHQAKLLLQQGIVVADVVKGYELAFARICDEFEKKERGLSVDTVDVKTIEGIEKVVRPALMAKQYGHEDVLAKLVSEACSMIMHNDPETGKKTFVADNVRVAKVPGSTIDESFVVRGFVIPAIPKGSVQSMKKCKIACYGCPVELEQTETKGVVLIEDAKDLIGLSKSEEQAFEARIKSFADAGINVIAAQNNFHELAVHYCNKYGIMALKIGSKFEIRRFAKSTNSQLLMTFRLPTAEERCGSCGEMSIREIGDRKVIICRDLDNESENKTEGSREISTIVLRSATQNVLNDMAAALGNAVNVAKAVCDDPRIVPGAGATEMHLANILEDEANRETGLEQYALRAFSESLKTIPRMLAETSGLKGDSVMTRLQVSHSAGEHSTGVNVEAACAREEALTSDLNAEDDNDYVIDAMEANIVDSLAVKQWAIRMSVDAACTVLKVDQVIMRKMAGGPKVPKPKGQQEWN